MEGRMNVGTFAEWLRRQGHTVYRTESSYWYDAGPKTLQAFPYHWLIKPSEAELRKLILPNFILSLRYSTPIDASAGKVSYHVELRRPYTLEQLKPQARNGVRKGQANLHLECVPFERLADEGWQLQRDTLERQARLPSMSQETWRRICLSASGLEGFQVWAAIAQGELAGALFTAQIGDVVCVPYALSRTCYLCEHVNNFLFFHASCAILAQEAIDHIFFTVQSLDAPESVDEFKFRMDFAPVLVRQRVVLHPLLAPLATAPGHRLFQRLACRYPNSALLAKTEGMLRFSRMGRRPLAQQDWPNCVKNYKDKLLDSTTGKPGRPQKTETYVGTHVGS
jgi:hypothetical protein